MIFKTKSSFETDTSVLKNCLIQTNNLMGHSINMSKSTYIISVEVKKDMHIFIQGKSCCI